MHSSILILRVPTNIEGRLYSTTGQLLQTIQNMQPSISYSFDLTKYPSGVYTLHLKSGKDQVIQKITVIR